MEAGSPQGTLRCTHPQELEDQEVQALQPPQHVPEQPPKLPGILLLLFCLLLLLAVARGGGGGRLGGGDVLKEEEGQGFGVEAPLSILCM